MLDISYTKVEVKEVKPNFARIAMAPLPPGYGMTFGNAFRRVLLSSMPGAAVTSIKVKKASHEFTTIPGIKENLIDIILNIKKLRFKKFVIEPVTLKLTCSKEGPVLAKEMKCPSSLELVNPDLILANLGAKGSFSIEMKVESGYGYEPGAMREEDPEPGWINIDALFSPVMKVRYEIENTRKGSMTNLDKLIFEIETDGTITPQDVLSYSSRILRDYTALFDFDAPPSSLVPEAGQAAEEEEEEEEEEEQKYTPVETLKLSPRTLNALINNDIGSIEELITKNEQQLINLKGFGKKALTEVRDALVKIDLNLA